MTEQALGVPEPISQLLTITDILERLRISRSTLERWRRTQKFPEPLLHKGRFARWSTDQVQGWLLEQEVSPEGQNAFERGYTERRSDPFLVLFDIDDCLLDSTHRKKYVDAKDWPAYFASWTDDKPIPQGITLARMFLASHKYRVLFVTARTEKTRHTTLQQLQRFVSPKITNKQLLMRPIGVYSEKRIADKDVTQIVTDADMKPWLLKRAGYSVHDVFFVYEDMNSVVKRWRDLGVTVLQPKETER